MRDVTIHQKQDGWTAVKTRKKKSDDKPPRQECHSLSTMSFQSNDCNLQSYAHLVYITPSLLTRKNLALQSKNPAQRRWSSLLVNQWRLDFHDQGQNLQMRAISQKVPTTKYTKLDQRETRACFPGDGRLWTEQHLWHNLWRAAAELGACLLLVVALFLPCCYRLHCTMCIL